MPYHAATYSGIRCVDRASRLRNRSSGETCHTDDSHSENIYLDLRFGAMINFLKKCIIVTPRMLIPGTSGVAGGVTSRMPYPEER